MVVPDRKLRDGEIRFEVRKIDKLWRVYDKVRMSFPYHNKELGGKVAQDLPEKEAQVEVDRMNAKFPATTGAGDRKSSGKKKRTSQTSLASGTGSSRTVQAKDVPDVPDLEPETTWIDESQISDYGVFDDETAKKYVEGIL